MRLDRYMVREGIARTRSQAREAIARGAVTVDGIAARTAGQEVREAARVEASGCDYVGRGAHKLIHALEEFSIGVEGTAALDVGASTGGFTEVLLRQGAARVIALDVGHGQLAPSLAEDPRVRVMEGVNARHLRPEELPYRPDLVVVDVSFISLALVLPPVIAAAADELALVALVKPQFEVGREGVGKGGIVREPAAVEAAVARVVGVLAECGLAEAVTTPSPIAGADGNTEWLAAARR